MGLYLCLAVVIPLFIGLRIDDRLHSTPIGLGSGSLLVSLQGFPDSS